MNLLVERAGVATNIERLCESSAMEIINFKSPVPLLSIKSFDEYRYPVNHHSYLPKIQAPSSDLFNAAGNRRTRREFGKLERDDLACLLWYSCHVKIRTKENGKVIWQARPAPSAGGRHPIDVLIVEPTDNGWEVGVYDPFAHCICKLSVDQSIVEDFLLELADIVSIQHATILWCVAQPLRTLSKYENGESLVWRDAGVLQGHWSLIAEGLSLSSCLVGITGHEWIRKLLPSGGKLIGMGGCLIGSVVEDR